MKIDLLSRQTWDYPVRSHCLELVVCEFYDRANLAQELLHFKLFPYLIFVFTIIFTRSLPLPTYLPF